jgi:hypothetical protein
MHQMVSQTRIGDGVVDHAEWQTGGVQWGGENDHQILPDNSNVGMIVHKGCIRKGMLQVVLALAVSEFDKMRMYSFRTTGSNVYDFFYRILGCYVLTILTAPSLITP